MKKGISLLCALFALLAALAACSKDEVTVLSFAVPNTAGSFDPQVASDVTARIVARNCFEGLVYTAEDGSTEPGMAASWDLSADGRVYTFHLRQGEKWHLTTNAAEELEGKLPAGFAPAVTAADFAFALRRAADPATGAPDADLLLNVQNAAEIAAGKALPETLGVEAVDDYTLRITLSQPQADFLQVLSEPLCMPCNQTFFEATGGRYGLLIRYSLMNGPFYLSRFDDNSYRVAKNPDYRGAHTPTADIIWLYRQTDEKTLFSSLRVGDYDGAYLTAAQMEALAPGEECTAIPLHDILRCILVNPTGDNLKNDHLRAAFFAAADVSSLCEDFGRTPAMRLAPGAVWNNTTAYHSVLNAATAATELKLGLEETKQDSVKFSLLCEPAYETALKKQLQAWQKTLGMGMNVGIYPIPAEELLSRVAAGDYEMAFAPVTALSGSPYFWFSSFSANGKNSVLPMESAAFDKTTAALLQAGEDERAKAFATAEATLLARHTVLPVWEESNYFICTEGVRGVRVLPGSDRLYLYAATAD